MATIYVNVCVSKSIFIFLPAGNINHMTGHQLCVYAEAWCCLEQLYMLPPLCNLLYTGFFTASPSKVYFHHLQ
jgi:hypothetical protein